MNIRGPRPIIFGVSCVECFYGQSDGSLKKCSSGSGFFTQSGDQWYLCTNWHVITGKDPSNPGRSLPGYPPVSPTHISFSSSHKDLKQLEVIDSIPLYGIDEKPLWFECEEGFEAVDLIMLPVDIPPQCGVLDIEKLSLSDIDYIEPGKDVAVIGFPYALDFHPAPLWKNAMIASEPKLNFRSRNVFLVDTPGRSGMSGSSVFFLGEGVYYRDKKGNPLTKAKDQSFISFITSNNLSRDSLNDVTISLKFVGVYTGSYGDNEMNELRLGTVIPWYWLDRLKQDMKAGQNRFPPFEA